MYRGTGIYTLSAAARLINVPAKKMHRWLYGYAHGKRLVHSGEPAYSTPLWALETSGTDFDSEVIGFRDLLEVRFVAAFVEHGVPLIVIRRCLETAREVLGIDYPMSSGAFKTDGKTIFAEAVQQTAKECSLLDLRSRQFAFRDIISPSLYAGIEYEGKRATKWYPQGKRHHVVLDPLRQFGSPIVDETGTPTDVLFASFRAEGGTREAIMLTSRVYDVSPRMVEAAVRFEQNLRQPTH